MARLRFHLLMAVWGEPYIETMVELAIPSLLSAGNLPALAARHDCRVVFFVRASEEARIRRAPSVERLARLVPIELVHIEPDGAADAYAAMSAAHLRGCVAATADGAKAIFLFPDGVFADGSLGKVGVYAEQGKVAVICAGPILARESALPALRARVASAPLSARALAALMRRHLHPEARRSFIDSPNFCTWPTLVYWSLGAKGMLMRGCHLHPLMIDVELIASFEPLTRGTVDGLLLGETLDDWSAIHAETDSDNICVCSLTPAARVLSPKWYRRFELKRLHNTVHGPLFTGLHRHFFTRAIRIHTGDLDGPWRRLEERTAPLAQAIQSPPAAGVEHRPPEWPKRLLGWAMTALRDLRARATGRRY